MVLNKSYILVIISAVLVLIANESNGKEEAVQQCVSEFEKGISNAEYRNRHKEALDALNDVNKGADKAQQKVSKDKERDAVNEVRTGFLDSIKCVAVAGDRAYEAKKAAEESSDSAAAKDGINKGVSTAKKGIAVAGVAAYQSLGSATLIAGNYSKESLRESITYVTRAGQAAYSGFQESQTIAISGLVSVGSAKKQGLLAFNETIEATEAACCFYLLKASKIAFEGLDRSRPSTPEEDSSGTEAARKSPDASSAIDNVKNMAKSTRSKMTEGSSLDAVNEVKDGIIAAIRGVAAAIQKPQEVVKSAQKTNSEPSDSESAEKSIRRVFSQAVNDIAYAAAKAYQSLGKAGERVGGEKKGRIDMEAMPVIERGRYVAYKSLQSAKLIALEGLEAGETAKQTGLTAAYDAVLTGAFAAYAEFMKGAKISFDILKA